jgi:outer membrane beta-barrel protein
MKRLLLALVFGLAALPTVSFAQSADEAGDVSEVDKDRVGPLRERVHPVSGHMFLKRGRFEFTPSVTRSFNDAFFTKNIFGADLGFFPTEEFGLHLSYGYAMSGVSGAAEICPQGSNCKPPTLDQLDGKAPGQITTLGGLDAEYAPIYGKIALFSESFLHFDLHAIGGAALVGYKGPADPGATTASKQMTTVGGNVGLGTRIFLNKWLTARADLRDLVYQEQLRSSQTSLRNQLLFELGLSFFLPTSFIPE